MTILIVDHQDSFVNNLVAWVKQNYSGSVKVLQWYELQNISSNDFCGVIFSPGPGHPSEYTQSLEFYKKLPSSIPFLGVCLGYQIMLSAYSAILKQISLIPIHGQQIYLRKKINSRLLPHNVLQGAFVLYNSLGVEKSDTVFKKHFALLAVKNKFSLAAEHLFLPHVGVQFHPESFASPNGDNFMHSFLRLILC